jgi:hypothetical protein
MCDLLVSSSLCFHKRVPTCAAYTTGSEYVRVVKLATPKEARAFIGECQKVVAAKAPGVVQQQRKCTRS